MSTDEGPRGYQVKKSLDCSGKRCPVPIYMASRALKTLAVGDVLEVKTTDASSINDFPGFADREGHTLLAVEKKEGDKVNVFYLQKGER